MISLTDEIKKYNYWLELMNEMKVVPLKYFNPEYIDNLNITSYKWEIPRRVLIPQKDKLREIFIYNKENSVLQKIINKILNNHFDCLFSKSLFSYRKHIKTSDAVRTLKTGFDKYAFKLDISNYFLSVKFDLIEQSIKELIIDKEGQLLLLHLFSIRQYEDKKGVHDKYLGLMPGCAISVFFANYILTKIDDVMTSTCDIYARYSDDMIMYNKSLEELEISKSILTDELGRYGLELHPKKLVLYEPYSKLEFLGLTIDSKSKIDISSKTNLRLKSFIKRVCKSERKKIELGQKSIDNSLHYIIKKFNRFYYKWGVREDKCTVAEYIFSVIETISTLREIDFYFKDNLKYVVTGKHNRANDRLNLNYNDLGFRSLCAMFNLFKQDRDIYRNEVDLL